MTFLIDNFFIDEFNKFYKTDLTYKEFVHFHKEIRQKKKSLGLVKKSSRDLTREEIENFNALINSK